MPIIEPEFVQQFNRKRIERQKERNSELRAIGVEPYSPPQPPLPAPTARASRPDLYETFAQGVTSATRGVDMYPAGNNLDDTNVMPDNRIATNGVPYKDRGIDPHGRAKRPRKQR